MKKVFHLNSFKQNIMAIKTVLQHNFHIKETNNIYDFRNININMIFYIK